MKQNDKELMKNILVWDAWIVPVFIGMMLAISWTNVIDLILNIIKEKFPFVAVAWAVSFAFIVTFIWILALFYGHKGINALIDPEKDQKPEDIFEEENLIETKKTVDKDFD